MKKIVLMVALLMLVVSAEARQKSRLRIDPVNMIAGDFITAISNVAITDDSKPWFVKDLSRTVVSLGEVAGNTATAVAFNFDLPNDYNGGGELFALVKPAAASFAFSLRADVQVQGGVSATDTSGVDASPTTVTAITLGLNTLAVAAANLDNLSFIPLSNTAFTTTTLTPNQAISVYLQRITGTGEDVYIHGVYFLYDNALFRSR